MISIQAHFMLECKKIFNKDIRQHFYLRISESIFNWLQLSKPGNITEYASFGIPHIKLFVYFI